MNADSAGVLITFLGRATQDPTTGYRAARYRFPDGSERETPFFGLALREHIHPARMVILGTPGSMWEILIEQLAAEEDEQFEDQRLRLLEAAGALAVEEEHLLALRPLAERALGLPCELMLVEYGRTLDEQISLLDQLYETVEAVRGGGAVHVDVTHGLRHLAMLGLVGCQFLEAMSSTLSVEEIWYGALELAPVEGGVAPVLQLRGLARLQRWVQAIERFEQEGEYGQFAELLLEEGLSPETARLLEEAAFLESVLNLPEARRRLQTFLDRTGGPLPGIARLFGRRLRERVSWVRAPDLYQHQRRLAHLHRRKGDYLRAAVLGYEAVLTRWMTERGEGDVNRFQDRDRAREALRRELDEGRRDAEAQDFFTLEMLRNALAHGTAPRHRRVRDLLRNRTRLDREFERILSRLLS